MVASSIHLVPPTQRPFFPLIEAGEPPPPASPPPKRRRGRPSLWDEIKEALMRAQYAAYRAIGRLCDLAERLGVSLSCLYKRAQRANLTIRRPRRPALAS